MVASMFPRRRPVHIPRHARLHTAGIIGVVVLFLGGGFLAVPGADAQGIIIGMNRDMTFGWTFPEGDLPGATIDDPAGDLALSLRPFGVGGAQSAPFPAPVVQGIDVTSFSVHEADAERLLMRLTVADLDSVLTRTENWFLGSADIDIDFTLGGRSYRLSGYVSNTCDPAEARCEDGGGYYIRLFLSQYGSDDRRTTLGQVPTRMDREAGTIEVIVPRWSLDRAGPGEHPLAEDTVDEVRVRTTAYGFLWVSCDQRDCYSAVSVTDALPDEEPVRDLYTLQVDSVGSRVGVGAMETVAADDEDDDEDDDDDRSGARNDFSPLRPRSLMFDVAPGEAPRIPLQITNHMGRKTIVEPFYEVLSGPDGIDIRGPPHIEVASGKAIKMELVVDSAATFTVDEPLVLRVGIQALGIKADTADQIDVVVRHVPVLSYETPRLYFHTRGDPGNMLYDEGVRSFTSRAPYMNALADDPGDDGAGTDLRSCCFRGVGSWSTEAAPAKTLPLDVAVRGTLHMQVESHEPGTLEVDLGIDQGEERIGSSSTTVDLVQGLQDVEVPIVLREEATQIDPGTPLEVYLSGDFRPANIPFGELTVAFIPEHGPFMRTGGASWIEFPILEATPVSTEADHLVVDLEGDAATYVNPGGSALWRLTVLNQADTDETVTLSNDPVPDGWTIDFEPGHRFKLGPGESVDFAARMRAPEDAAEGDVLEANISVASALRDGATTGIRLSGVVTHGADVPEETFEADNETVARLDVDDAEESPAVPPMVALVALGFVAALRRRR